MIDRDGHACVADFGLTTIALDSASPKGLSSSVKGGTTRWMSPELLNPELFGIRDSQPTKESDSYALGMVILEVLGGRSPFDQFKEPVVMLMVLDGKRPERPNGPEGAWFTDGLWQMLTLCWESQRESQPSIEAILSRPSIETILEFLEKVSGTWEPPSPQVDEVVDVGEDDFDLTRVSVPFPDSAPPATRCSCGGVRAGCFHDLPEGDSPRDGQGFKKRGPTDPECTHLGYGDFLWLF